MNRSRWLTALALLVAALSAVDPRGAIFALLLNCIALAALPPKTSEKEGARRLELVALLGALALNVISLGRFVVREAMPGISDARVRDESGRAVSRLREILFAEDAFRRLAPIDPDGDKLGSAGLLAELSGDVPVRGADKPLELPPLAPRFAPRVITDHGPAFEEGEFLYYVCLPQKDGSYSARPSLEIDDEKAERSFLAYAWPASDQGRFTVTYFIDQDEQIGETAQGTSPLWAGPYRAPPCDAAIHPDTRALFSPWKGKKARPQTPGPGSPD